MNAQTHDDMNDKWLNELRDRMADHREPAPDGLWDDIASRLKCTSVPAEPAAPNRNPVALWIRRSAVAAMLALALTLGYDRLARLDASDPAAERETAENVAVAHALPSEDGTTSPDASAAADVFAASGAIVSDAIASAPSARKAVTAAVNAKLLRTAPTAETEGRDAVETLGAAAPQPIRRTDLVEIPAEDSPSAERERKEKPAENPEPDRGRGGMRKRRPSVQSAMLAEANTASGAAPSASGRGRLTAAVRMSGLNGSSDSRHSANGAMMMSADLYRHISVCDDPLADPLTVVMLYNRNAPVDTEIKHRPPLRFGFSLRYMITPAVGIESGITYTLLMSTVNSGGARCYYDEDRTFHYMGIPVNLVCNAWSGGRLAFYLSGGAGVEKCVAGRARTRYVLHDRPASTERRDIGIAPLQWSLAAAAGLQYGLSRRTGLYIEPGIGYYFDNGGETETAYSRRPLNFSLNMGVRISFD